MKRALVPPSGREPLTPRNPEQADYLEAIQNNDQVFALGKAGTGKTYIPTCYAANLLLMGNQIDKLIVARPAVACGGERLGALPGKLEQKIAPWMVPVVEVLEERLGAQNVANLIADGTIKAEAFEHIRGRTFKNAFVMLDEAQNTTKAQMKAFLTRMGEGSRMVVCGDVGQSDIGGENGLAYALRLADKYNLPVPILHLKKVERGGICAMWGEAIEKEEGS